MCHNDTVLWALLAFKVLRTLLLLKNFNSIQIFWSINSLNNFISIKSLRSIFERSWTQCFWVFFLLVHTLFSNLEKDSALLHRLITFFSRSIWFFFFFQNYDISRSLLSSDVCWTVEFGCLLSCLLWRGREIWIWNWNLKLNLS